MVGVMFSIAAAAFALLELHAQCADGVVSPCGGERVANGAPLLIRWNAAELPAGARVGLWLWDGERGRFTEIAQNVPAESGSYLWQVPHELRGRLFRIQLRAQQRVLMSPTYFWIGVGIPSEVAEQAGFPDRQLRVMPNPASETVELHWEGIPAVQVRVYDVYGRMHVLHAGPSLPSPIRLSVTGLAVGAYAVELLLRNGQRLRGMLLRW